MRSHIKAFLKNSPKTTGLHNIEYINYIYIDVTSDRKSINIVIKPIPFLPKENFHMNKKK